MIETIHTIKNRVIKLLQHTEELKQELNKNQEEYVGFQSEMALLIIEQKDQLEAQIKDNHPNLYQTAHLQDLNTVLERLNVVPLADPLDKLADFIHIVNTIPDAKKANGRVVEILKKGYMMNDELIRPTHVVIVDNTKKK